MEEGIVVGIFSLVSAALYRAGGIGKPFNTKVRDFGCPLVSCITLGLIGVEAQWWQWFLYFGAAFGAMTTYHKYISEMFWEDGSVHWPSWAMTGLVYGLSAMFLYTYWPGILIRSLILAAATCLWSVFIDNDVLEEAGRGFLFNISLPLILI